MKYRVESTATAEADIDAEFQWLYERSPQGAVAWYHRIREGIESLAVLPERCPLAPESGMMQMAIRHRIIGHHRILFVVLDGRRVQVLAIREGHQQPATPKDLGLGEN